MPGTSLAPASRAPARDRSEQAAPPDDDPRIEIGLPTSRVALVLGVSQRTVQRYITEGLLKPFFLPTGRPRIPASQIVAIQRQTKSTKHLRKHLRAARAARARFAKAPDLPAD